jgi:hypothetical protein
VEIFDDASENGTRPRRIGPCGSCFRFRVPCPLATPCHLQTDVVLDLDFYDERNRGTERYA